MRRAVLRIGGGARSSRLRFAPTRFLPTDHVRIAILPTICHLRPAGALFPAPGDQREPVGTSPTPNRNPERVSTTKTVTQTFLSVEKLCRGNPCGYPLPRLTQPTHHPIHQQAPCKLPASSTLPTPILRPTPALYPAPKVQSLE